MQALRVALRETTGVEPTSGQTSLTLAATGLAILWGIVVAPGIFIDWPEPAADLAEATLRAAALIVYLALVSRSSSAQRLFAYHGAEHKVVAAFERSALMPTREQARASSPIHPRCGTSFFALFVVAAGVLFSFVPRESAWVGGVLRVALVPFVAAAAYEVMRSAARVPGSVWARVAGWPGRMLQRITTREPSDDRLDVALAAMRELIAR